MIGILINYQLIGDLLTLSYILWLDLRMYSPLSYLLLCRGLHASGTVYHLLLHSLYTLQYAYIPSMVYIHSGCSLLAIDSGVAKQTDYQMFN